VVIVPLALKLSRENRPANDDSGGRAADPDPATHGLRDGIDGLRDLMDRLLAPDGCPWDREQSLQSLRPYLLEEAHEVLEAMDDPEAHCKELGDLLFQIVFQAALRERERAFDLDDVIAAVRDKMIHRHPHVFAPPGRDTPLSVDDAHHVARRWEQIKRTETTGEEAPDPLAGVPRGLPALLRAWRLQEKAAAVGFDWPDVEGTLAKLDEEWRELEEARKHGTPEQTREEFGDFLFVLVRVGQKLGINPEDAMRSANEKFERRFAHVMRQCRRAGLDPATAGLETLERFWDEAKNPAR
jgi:MazG family protein